MERLSDRHEGDLDGRLHPIDHVDEVAVAVVVAPETAQLSETQHTAWMLINLLARAQRVVHQVKVSCPTDVALTGRIVPLAPRDVELAEALVSGGEAVGAVPVTPGSPGRDDVVLIVGATRLDGVPGRHVRGRGWWGGVGDSPIELTGAPNDLPFGPYVAAALAAAEVFLDVRLPAAAERRPTFYGWDCWKSALVAHPGELTPADLRKVDLSGTALAGVGAVGAAWVHTIWATPGLIGDVTLADADAKGITTSNLNRCALFGHAGLDQPKADEAARLTADSTVTWRPHHSRLEELPDLPTLLVSAVDTNRAREALQHRYPPRILSGSTRDLRAEILCIGPPGVGACLRCYNKPESFTGDDELRARTRTGGPDAIAALAKTASVPTAEVADWVEQGSCDEVGARLLRTLRAAEQGREPPRFAVGFTSVMAGVLLAAETIKTLIGTPLTSDSPRSNNVTFQFFAPASNINGAEHRARDLSCAACAPTNPATAVWRRRFDGKGGGPR
ncbi:hypothetical protein Amsp01_048910 [Amycolatopsis sp. NBRC 101858]|uniref:ThiF family adenylyltransferase n=1 Tax=Amycolatopsis sp. NBRC 101858 TaxID=3032200 RepID=UPI0024A028A0|nr:ThiF family adenylyltransferase [Amycolatopsis sp. NBRC 101858]GLY38867.1 hypothetical protein Amsp01_048910 [Amycolatopsis sp. NBRC 101858]